MRRISVYWTTAERSYPIIDELSRPAAIAFVKTVSDSSSVGSKQNFAPVAASTTAAIEDLKEDLKKELG